jgi:hypothetical protein
MRKLFAALLFFCALPTFATGLCGLGGCGTCGSVRPTRLDDVYIAPSEEITLRTTKPSVCTRGYSAQNGGVAQVSVRSFSDYDEVTVHGIAPGDSTIFVSGTFGSDVLFVAHVQACSAGSHAINLLPAYSAPAPALIRIVPQLTGNFDRGLFWFVNGQYLSTDTVLRFIPPSNGVYSVKLRGESACGIVEAQTSLYVGPQRLRSVRKR